MRDFWPPRLTKICGYAHGIGSRKVNGQTVHVLKIETRCFPGVKCRKCRLLVLSIVGSHDS